MQFSCNEKANQYALTNIATNQSISRDSLAKLPYEYQFAVFESLSAQNKHRIFKEKIDHVLSLKNLDNREVAALERLKALDPNEIYNLDQEEPADILWEWEQYVRKELAWSDQTIFEKVGTWLTTEEMQVMASVYSPSEAAGTCTCQSDWSCIWSGSSCNYNAGCNVTQSGCGILGGAKCKGNCGSWPLSPGPTQEYVPGNF